MDTVSLQLPEDLSKRVAVAAAVTNESQSALVRTAVRTYLESFEEDRAVREMAIEHYLDGTFSADGLEWYLDSADAAAVQSASELLGQGDGIARDLAADDC